jgi:hypothetical protein
MFLPRTGRGAELIFVVRTGRIAEGKVGGSVGAPNSGPLGNPYPGQQQHPMGTGVMLGGEVGPADDLLKVVMTNGVGHGITGVVSNRRGRPGQP